MDMEPNNVRPIGVFGLGPVGLALVERLEWEGTPVAGCSRSLSAGSGRRFDAADPASVAALAESLPVLAAAVVTFPPERVASEFWPTLARLAGRRILVGTTSSYRRQSPGREILTEASPLDPDHKRYAVETDFLGAGGHILRVSGIYGRGRNPVRWVQGGRLKDEDRQVNLIHVDDIAAALAGLLRLPELDPVYNLADGQEHTWRQIIDWLDRHGHLARRPEPAPPKPKDAFVDPAKIRAALPELQPRDFWAELPRLAEAAAESQE